MQDMGQITSLTDPINKYCYVAALADIVGYLYRRLFQSDRVQCSGKLACILKCAPSPACLNNGTKLDVPCARKVLPLWPGGRGRPGRLVLEEVEVAWLPSYDLIHHCAKLPMSV